MRYAIRFCVPVYVPGERGCRPNDGLFLFKRSTPACQQVGQFSNIRRDPPCLVFGEQLGGAKMLRLSGRINRWQIQFRDLSSVYRQ